LKNGAAAGVFMGSRFHTLMLRERIKKSDIKFLDLTDFLGSKNN